MSTITREFTKEQLQEIIENDHVQCGEASALARILLASLEAKPVAYLNYRGTLITFGSFGYDATPDNPIPLYAIQPAHGVEA
jgi:hypothetical protein